MKNNALAPKRYFTGSLLEASRKKLLRITQYSLAVASLESSIDRFSLDADYGKASENKREALFELIDFAEDIENIFKVYAVTEKGRFEPEKARKEVMEAYDQSHARKRR